MSCHVMSCHVMSCHVMSCHVMYVCVFSCTQRDRCLRSMSMHGLTLRLVTMAMAPKIKDIPLSPHASKTVQDVLRGPAGTFRQALQPAADLSLPAAGEEAVVQEPSRSGVTYFSVAFQVLISQAKCLKQSAGVGPSGNFGQMACGIGLLLLLQPAAYGSFPSQRTCATGL